MFVGAGGQGGGVWVVGGWVQGRVGGVMGGDGRGGERYAMRDSSGKGGGEMDVG